MTGAMLQMTGRSLAMRNPRDSDSKLTILWQIKTVHPAVLCFATATTLTAK
jgi:hypothetical protein